MGVQYNFYYKISQNLYTYLYCAANLQLCVQDFQKLVQLLVLQVSKNAPRRRARRITVPNAQLFDLGAWTPYRPCGPNAQLYDLGAWTPY